ncbi:hypothetical protein AQJ27_33715 [Streptomyces olivochromogenes]|uniref:Uncharacterized protein n=1 Tax=Streptomyces olivochromogenes TaxID=1963 RepID=A0A250VJ45_STROL|nr:hypothetical protein AQJ27_33715 [Streptomyces olivochromogenes]GAX54228.1 hypothetical protein SO3561_05767 [Streptomyces olivochromogenes]
MAGGGGDLVGGLDFDAEVIHAGFLAGFALDQDELERRFGDGEIRVAVAPFRRLTRALQDRFTNRARTLIEVVGLLARPTTSDRAQADAGRWITCSRGVCVGGPQ